MENRNLSEKRIALIGTDYQSIITKHYLDYERAQFRYIITAYFTKDDSLMNKTIEGAPVYHIQKLATMLDIIKIDSLILVAEKGYGSYISGIKETCIQKNIKFIESNQLKNWVDLNEKANLRADYDLEKLLQRPPIKLDIQRIKSEIQGKEILVTGAAGSIGAEICRQIIKYSPSKLMVLDQAESPLFEIENELREKYTNLQSFIADISDLARLTKIIQSNKPEIIFHAAAYKHVPLMEEHPYEAVKTNIIGTKNLVDLAIENQCKKLVMISTDKAVNPTNVMGATKRAAELYVQLAGEKSNTQFVTTRFGNVLGSNGSVIPVFKNQIESGGPVKVTHPEITRFFMTIPEACQLVLEAGTYGEGNEIFLFDMGQPVKILDLARNMISLYGLKEGKDIEIEFVGLRPGEKLYEELLADEENTISTHHEKILKAKHAVQNSKEIEMKWSNLLEVYSDFKENDSLVRALKDLVPEYISNNSEFEKLDKE